MNPSRCRIIAVGKIRRAWVQDGINLYLKRLKGLRGTKFDLFGWTNERKQERRLRDEYIARIRGLLAELTANKLDLAVEIAELPDQIRGYGYVKDKSVEEAAQKLEQLMAAWNAPTPPQQVAAE